MIPLALGLAIFGTIHFTRSLELKQRVIAWLVLALAAIWLVVKLVHMGVLGRATGAE